MLPSLQQAKHAPACLLPTCSRTHTPISEAQKPCIQLLLVCPQELMVPCQSLKQKAQCPLTTPIMAPTLMAPCLITPTMAMALCPHMAQGLTPTAP